MRKPTHKFSCGLLAVYQSSFHGNITGVRSLLPLGTDYSDWMIYKKFCLVLNVFFCFFSLILVLPCSFLVLQLFTQLRTVHWSSGSGLSFLEQASSGCLCTKGSRNITSTVERWSSTNLAVIPDTFPFLILHIQPQVKSCGFYQLPLPFFLSTATSFM